MSTLPPIVRRFCGPPASGNGGYASGVAARAIPGPAWVRLTLPPPLGSESTVRADGVDAEVVGPTGTWARVTPFTGEIEAVDPVPLAVAEQTVAGFDEADYADGHIFPGCFTCGPAREPGDGLRIFPGAVADRPDVVAWPWTPDASLVDDGAIPDEVVWAALDCPSGMVWMDEVPAFVLGGMAARIERSPVVGEPLVVGGWRGGADGRRLEGGSAIWDAEGTLLAAARATWVVLSAEQAATFQGG